MLFPDLEHSLCLYDFCREIFGIVFSTEMALPSPSALFTAILEPRPLVILSTLAVALLLPVLLHLILYRSSSSVSLPSFLLTGPSGAGKTSLMLRVRRIICNFAGLTYAIAGTRPKCSDLYIPGSAIHRNLFAGRRQSGVRSIPIFE